VESIIAFPTMNNSFSLSFMFLLNIVDVEWL
jgi:hypothetical protein